jgi:uncharacterized protein YbdZ (MbtH family)
MLLSDLQRAACAIFVEEGWNAPMPNNLSQTVNKRSVLL